MTFQSDGTCVLLESESRQPHNQALKTLQEVLSWKPSSEQSFCSRYFGTKGFVRPSAPRTKPYTLVCHDFKGGYLEDRYLQGGTKKDAYYFCRWECIDIFVYFSHHFVTVPPLGWIRAAHKHGTMMLGTIITEWGEGAALCSSLLACEDTMHRVITNLVDICCCHGFDGWLVNIENKIEENQVSNLRKFVEQLTQACHKKLPHCKVLWYDSVTRSGELKWQDQLNEKNSMFFDACDGIFLNYCWTPQKLAASRDVAVEKKRPFDVFVGIDVFGRGCPGGGGFNTREALEQARAYNLSAAVFAPGWVLETLGISEFDDNDCRFWAKLHDLCLMSGATRLPLSSAFCQGHGDAFFCMGQAMTSKPWYNMTLQQRQPERSRVYGFQDPSKLVTTPSLNTCLSSAYLGGCSVELSAHLTRPLQSVTFRLFQVQATLDETLYCSYTYKENSDVPCEVYLVLTLGSGLLVRQVIMGCGSQPPTIDTDCEPASSEAKSDVHCESTSVKSDANCDPTSSEAKSDADCQSTSTKSDAEYEPNSKKARHDADCEPAPTRAKPATESLYVSAMSAEDLQAVQRCLWFHDLQLEDGQQGQDGWKTRHFKVDTSQLKPGCMRPAEESMSVAVCLAAPAQDGHPFVHSNLDDSHQDIHRASILLGHLQVFREQDLKLEAPRVSGLKLLKLKPGCLDPPTYTDASEQHGRNGDAARAPSDASFVVLWDVDDESRVDYFNVYLMAHGLPCLVGHAASTTYVMPIAGKFVENSKVTVVIQPVLSATGLPLGLSKCPSQSVCLPVACAES